MKTTDPLFIPKGQPGAGVALIRRNRFIMSAVAKEIADREQFGPVGNSACGQCEERLPYAELFRCLYCLAYFCEDCAGEHFGQTREQYFTAKS